MSLRFVSYLQATKLACRSFTDAGGGHNSWGRDWGLCYPQHSKWHEHQHVCSVTFPQGPLGVKQMGPVGCLPTMHITGENPELRNPNLLYWAVNMAALCSRGRDSIFQTCLLANILTRESKTKGTQCSCSKEVQKHTTPMENCSRNETKSLGFPKESMVSSKYKFIPNQFSFRQNKARNPTSHTMTICRMNEW